MAALHLLPPRCKTACVADIEEAWALYSEIEAAVPPSPERIGYAALQKALDLGQRGRLKRAVCTMVSLEVLEWAGQRRGRAVTQGSRSLDDVRKSGISLTPAREIDLYPLLAAPLDEFITSWHRERRDPIFTADDTDNDTDGVTTYFTSATRVSSQGPARHTRPDLTVITDLRFDNLGDWHEVHAIEVKPYWAVDRTALFEAAAQAALRRCTFSWVLLWIPDAKSQQFTGQQQDQILTANSAIDSLEVESRNLGIGLLLASELGEGSKLSRQVEPNRLVMEPRAADELFRSLGRG